MNFLILGSGPAGIFAVEAIRSRDKESSIIMVTPDKRFAFSPVMLTYWICRRFKEENLYFRESSWQERKMVDVRLNRRALSLETIKKEVTLSDGETIPYDRLLIATGSLPISLPIPGIDLNGVCKLRTLDDVENILKYEERLKEVVIIGGGLIGLKLACHLKEKGLNVWVLEKEPKLASRNFDEITSLLVKKSLKENGIEVETDVEAIEILGHKGWVSGVKLKNGRIVSCQRIIQAIGVRPNIEFIVGSGINIENGILVNERMETNISDIYAAGDVTITIDPITSERVNHATWFSATRQGIVAGTNMAGGNRSYKHNFLINSLNLFGLHIMTAGHGYLNEGEGVEVYIDEREGSYRKIVMKEGRPIGFILVRDVSKAGFLLSLMKRGIWRLEHELPPRFGLQYGFLFDPFLSKGNSCPKIEESLYEISQSF